MTGASVFSNKDHKQAPVSLCLCVRACMCVCVCVPVLEDIWNAKRVKTKPHFIPALYKSR